MPEVRIAQKAKLGIAVQRERVRRVSERNAEVARSKIYESFAKSKTVVN
ncbi:hypothetical protein IKQ21_01800 [bacterium]|nr:hypothetical protein [bacterium]